MKLLYDANISHRLVELLSDLFPESTHVSHVDLERADDRAVWDYAVEHGFVLVSKDEDFHQLAFLYGPPPKVVWLRLGNCTTADVEAVVRERVEDIRSFSEHEDTAFLVLERADG